MKILAHMDSVDSILPGGYVSVCTPHLCLKFAELYESKCFKMDSG